MNQNPVIIIMAKVPRLGAVKTRLRPILSKAQCVELAVCFLKDTFKKARKICPNVIIAFSPDDGRNELKKLLPEMPIMIEQTGNDLGERMQSAITFAENQKFSPIILIGTDSPTFPIEYLSQAIESFEENRVKIVLGAADDGGYYLIGFRNSNEHIFENIEWSSEKTFAQTAENVRKFLGCAPFQIRDWYDIDTPEDLKKLYQEFTVNKNFEAIAPKTAEWILNNRELFA